MNEAKIRNSRDIVLLKKGEPLPKFYALRYVQIMGTLIYDMNPPCENSFLISYCTVIAPKSKGSF